jgi:AcrR family transcriptional regulator
MSSEVSTAAQSEAVERQLSGDKVKRIVDAMRTCVATRGITGATFEHVSREAGVSRGLLHYYFGTKERLLIQVLRGDAEVRIRGADEILHSDPGFYVLLYELFTAARQNPEIRSELAKVYDDTRRHLAAILRRKEAEGVLSLRFDAETCVGALFALADGAALQRLTEPDRDYSELLQAETEVARLLLAAR